MPSAVTSVDDASSRPRGREGSWALFLLLAYTFLSTAAVITFGPEPSPRGQQADLWPDVAARAINEPSDRILYVVWLSAAALAVVAALALTRRRKGAPYIEHKGAESFGLFLILLVSLVAFLVPSTEPADDWRGISIMTLSLGILSALGISTAFVVGGQLRAALSVGLGMVAIAYFGAAAWQTSSSLRDPYHFAIVVEDVLRSASGRLPYIDFLPTYTGLLGAPLNSVRNLAWLDTVQAATVWILVLQFGTVALGFVLVAMTLRRNAVGLALLVFVGPIAFVQAGTGQSALQTVAVMPARVLLPVAGALLLTVILSGRFEVRVSESVGLSIVGIVFGLSAVNNLEFGGSAAVSAAIVCALSSRNLGSLLRRTTVFSIGVLIPVGFMIIYGFVFESTNVVHAALLVPLTYAAVGFDLHPVQTLGPYLIFVGLAVISIFLGSLGLRKSSPSRHRNAASVVLSFFGLWSMLSMFYFTGRSFSSVLVAGQGLQVAIMLGVLSTRLPTLARVVRIYGITARRSMALLTAVLPVALSVSLLLGGGTPQSVLAFGLSGQPFINPVSAVERQLKGLEEMDLWREGDEAKTIVIYGNSAMIASETGIRDGARMLPGFVEVSRELMAYQCENMPPYRFLVVGAEVASKMLATSECRAVLGRQIPDVSGSGEVPIVVFLSSPSANQVS